MNSPVGPSPERLLQLAWGYAPVLIIEAAVKNQVFDLLDDGPLTIAELAKRSGASVRGLQAIADALVGLQLLVREGDQYVLTDESAAHLVSNRPGSLSPFFRHMGEHVLPAWSDLSRIVRNGRTPKGPKKVGQGSEYFAEFVQSIFPLSYASAHILGRHLRVGESTSPLLVLDLGAGSGVWGVALAEQSPHVEVTVVDAPGIRETTRQVARRCGVSDRIREMAGDPMEVVFGTGYHVATIGHILHSEGIERSRGILRRTYEALAPGGTVALMEFLVNEQRTGPAPSLMFAVNMLMHSDHGGAFTFDEIRGLLEEAGFVDPCLLAVPGPSPLILASKPLETASVR